MRNLLRAASLAALMTGTAHAATLIPVAPVPGAVTTNVFGINEDDIVVGDYTDASGIEHGFFGPPAGSAYTTFDYGTTALGTEPRAIDKDGNIVGFSPDSSAAIGPEFLRKADGTFVAIEKDGAQLQGIAQGLSRALTSVGDYQTEALTRLGYVAKKGTYKSDVDLSGVTPTRVAPRAIFGKTIAGWFADATGTHGFVLKDGVTQIVDVDASGTTTLEGINRKGTMSGQVVDEDLNNHAFFIDKHGAVTFIDVPGSTNQQAWGINAKGLIAVTSDLGSFIYCPLKPARCPAGGTAARTTQAGHATIAMSYRAGAAKQHRVAKGGLEK